MQSIVYHGGSPEKDFSKPELGASGFHGYFAAAKNVANEFAERWTRNKTSKGETKAILLNIQNPLITDKLYQGEYEQSVEKVKSTIKEGEYDGIIAKDTKDKFSDKLGAYDQYIAFKENQIHILGSEQDLTGFSEFILNGAINTNNKVTKVKNVPRDLKPSIHTFKVNGVERNTFDLLPIRLRLNQDNLSENDQKIFDAFVAKFGLTSKKQINEYLNKWTQRELQLLDLGYIMKNPINSEGEMDLNEYFGDDDLVTDIFRDVKSHYLLKNSVKVQNLKFSAAELILGDLYQTAFGRDAADSMYKIQKQGPEYFRNKLRSEFEDDATEADIKLNVSTSQDPIYIRFVSELPGYDSSINLKLNSELSTKENPVYTRYSNTGEPMYSIEDLDNVRVITEDKKEIILVKAASKVVQSKNKTEYYKVPEFNDNLKKLIKSFRGSIKSLVPLMNGEIKEVVTISGDNTYTSNLDSLSFREFSKFYGYKRVNDEEFSKDWFKNNKENIIDKLATRKYANWEKSQEFIAARIPSQSMQSFMPMKNVAYYKTESNDAFVSIYQIWLQGSDFDIDKAYILGSGFNKDGGFDL